MTKTICIILAVLFATLLSNCSSVTYAGQNIRKGSTGFIQPGVCLRSGKSIYTGEDFHTLSTCEHKQGRPDLDWIPVKSGTPVKVEKLKNAGSYTGGYYTRVYVSIQHPYTDEIIIAEATSILKPVLNGAVRPSNQFLKID